MYKFQQAVSRSVAVENFEKWLPFLLDVQKDSCVVQVNLFTIYISFANFVTS